MLLTCSGRVSRVCLAARLPRWMTHRSPVSCHSNYLETQFWASLKAPGELRLCRSHEHTGLCKPTHKDILPGVSRKARAHTCTQRNQLQSDTFPCTHRRRRIPEPLTQTHSGSQTDGRRAAVTGAALLF